MKKYIVVLLLVTCLWARNATSTVSGREFQILRHNVNQIEMCISNYGKFGQDETGNGPGCWWPIGTAWGDDFMMMLNNLSAGVGFHLRTGATEINIDYAYMNKGISATTHRIGLTIGF